MTTYEELKARREREKRLFEVPTDVLSDRTYGERRVVQSPNAIYVQGKRLYPLAVHMYPKSTGWAKGVSSSLTSQFLFADETDALAIRARPWTSPTRDFVGHDRVCTINPSSRDEWCYLVNGLM